MGLCSSRPWILQHLAMHMSRCCSFSIFACALHMTPLAAQVSSTGRSLAVHYRPRVTNASCTSPIQKVGISATVSSGGYITFVDYCRPAAPIPLFASPASQQPQKRVRLGLTGRRSHGSNHVRAALAAPFKLPVGASSSLASQVGSQSCSS